MTEVKKHLINLLEPEILVSVIVLISVCIILTVIIRQRIPDFKTKYISKFNLYIYVIVIVNFLIAFAGYNRLFVNNLMIEFIFYQCISLFIGCIHCYLYRSFFNKFEGNVIGLEYLFIIMILFYSIIPFLIAYTFLNGNKFSFIMTGHYVIFFLPTLLNETFNRAINIPPSIYKTWKFPENYKDLPGVTNEEMKDLVIFTLLIEKDKDVNSYSAFRAKGPTRIDFGRLFYSFVLDYNEKNPENEIIVEEENEFYDWLFFIRSKWYKSTKYVDADLPLYMNGIEENSVVICVRAPIMFGRDGANDKNNMPDYEYT